ncbi:MAG: DNA translocase FtsK 4TM domain-containing protein [Chitinophagaceae bacterium]|nr:DNA translocase FtsK 4TM domain-containing protein [Oligoflexus sp.]
MAEAAKQGKRKGLLEYLQLHRWINPEDGYSQEVLFVVCVIVALFLGVALASFSPLDPSVYNYSYPPRHAQNWGGIVGSYIAGFLIFQLGVLAYLLPLPVLAMAWMNLRGEPSAFAKGRLAGVALALVCLALAAQQWAPSLSLSGFSYRSGGTLGFWTQRLLKQTVGTGGLFIFLGGGLVMAALMLRQDSVIRPLFKALAARTPKKKAAPPIGKSGTASAEGLPSAHPNLNGEPELQGILQKINIQEKFQAAPLTQTKPTAGAAGPDVTFDTPKGSTTPAQTFEPLPTLEPDPSYVAPPTTMFRTGATSIAIDEEERREFEHTSVALVKAFSEFGVGGEVIAIQPGPVVTVYEFQPDAGTKLSKVTGLLDDIALALKVDSIFIHPVSGKRALGVQVPNKRRETVFLGDILQTSAFQHVNSPLNFVLGKGLTGEPICCDLASMPHLLTAGQTGSGKSVAINSLLCSLILKASPEQVRMILVDPKILELKIYEGIPHLLMPVITEPLKASLALKWACFEMDRRYQLMESAMVRHISGFNQYWDNASNEQKAEMRERYGDSIQGKLPYIVIVIDELADLMLTASKDVENSIQRLAQKARASGIHLVLATQRPSVDVITGVIKANLPCRIAFKVFSRTDSRTILDSMGAERLLGKGDMLFLRPGSSKLERIQGAFLSDEEVVAMVDQLKKTSAPHYDETAMEWINEEFQKQSGNGFDPGEENAGSADPKWNDAIQIAQRQGTISASYLQRMLKIGYNRAARIVESMESQGLVAKADGSKPRAWIGHNT